MVILLLLHQIVQFSILATVPVKHEFGLFVTVSESLNLPVEF